MNNKKICFQKQKLLKNIMETFLMIIKRQAKLKLGLLLQQEMRLARRNRLRSINLYLEIKRKMDKQIKTAKKIRIFNNRKDGKNQGLQAKCKYSISAKKSKKKNQVSSRGLMIIVISLSKQMTNLYLKILEITIKKIQRDSRTSLIPKTNLC